jgi:hypothetical protein
MPLSLSATFRGNSWPRLVESPIKTYCNLLPGRDATPARAAREEVQQLARSRSTWNRKTIDIPPTDGVA